MAITIQDLVAKTTGTAVEKASSTAISGGPPTMGSAGSSGLLKQVTATHNSSVYKAKTKAKG